MSRVLIKDIGTIVSGKLENPILRGDTVWIEDGIIRRVGAQETGDALRADIVVDCAGTTVIPGLIDTHCHPVLGDYTPKQNQIGFFESGLHCGVTTAISAGEIHLPGRPQDPAGTKALAILAAKSYANFRPGGVKVTGGALILEKGLEEKDFEEMAKEGVCLVGEIGLGSAKTIEDAGPMVRWAKKNGMKVMMHTGGTSMPGSTTVTADHVMRMDPDIVSHLNGGTTAVPIAEVERLIKDTSYTLELVHCGNPKVAVEAARMIFENGCLHRVIIGNDAPTGSGVIPMGMLRMMVFLASLTPIRAEQAICMATGNAAKVFQLNRGTIEAGREADIVVIDAPVGSAGKDALEAIGIGDIPGVSMVMVDGQILVKKSRNTAPAARQVSVMHG